MTRLLTVLGTRPDIVKLSPLLPLLDTGWQHMVVHTGEHYGYSLDGIFFEELRLRTPDIRLQPPSLSGGEQIAHLVAALEPILADVRPDAALVHGESWSAVAGALAADKLGIPLVHLDAGYYASSGGLQELNRMQVAKRAQLLLANNALARTNLLTEGVPAENIHVVGSTAIDACFRNVRFANRSSILQRLGLASRDYLLCTFHHPQNMHAASLPGLIQALSTVGEQHTLVIPLHPRTRAAMDREGLAFEPNVLVIDALGYIDFLQLLRHACTVLTDSSGLQEEAAALNIPLLVLRTETECTSQPTSRKAVLVGNRPDTVLSGVAHALSKAGLAQRRGGEQAAVSGAAARIIQILGDWLESRRVKGTQPDAHHTQAAAA